MVKPPARPPACPALLPSAAGYPPPRSCVIKSTLCPARPAGHRPLLATGSWSPKVLPLLSAHCSLTCTSDHPHQGQHGPEAGPGPGLGRAQPAHLCILPPSPREEQQSPDRSAHIPSSLYRIQPEGMAAPFPGWLPSPYPASALDWWKLPQLLPRQPVEPESGRPRRYCAALGPLRGPDPAASPTSLTTRHS